MGDLDQVSADISLSRLLTRSASGACSKDKTMNSPAAAAEVHHGRPCGLSMMMKAEAAHYQNNVTLLIHVAALKLSMPPVLLPEATSK